jgi:hypothetical protein
VAEVLAIVAAFFFALAATLQQKGALGMGEVSLGSPSSLVKLVKQPWWLAGTIALLCGYAFQAVALAHGRLAVIQPLLVTIFWDVNVNNARARFDESGAIVDDSFLAVGKFLDELVWMAETLRYGREHVTVGGAS